MFCVVVFLTVNDMPKHISVLNVITIRMEE